MAMCTGSNYLPTHHPPFSIWPRRPQVIPSTWLVSGVVDSSLLGSAPARLKSVSGKIFASHSLNMLATVFFLTRKPGSTLEQCGIFFMILEISYASTTWRGISLDSVQRACSKKSVKGRSETIKSRHTKIRM